MKKLLILLLVLGIASASYAAQVSFTTSDLQLKLSGGNLIVEWLQNAPASGNFVGVGIYEEQSPSQGSFSGTISTLGSPATAGSLWAATSGWDKPTPYNGFDFTGGSTGSESPPWNAAIGDWYSVAYSGSVGDSIAVYDYNVSSYTAIGYLIVKVPEPMTIALLSLGGLFLRRRK